MKQHAVLSVLGRDRVGAADDLAATLHRLDIDIENSRMAALGGRFAIIAQLCAEEERIGTLRRDLPRLRSKMGFHLELFPVEPVRPSTCEPHLLIESYCPEPSGLNAITGVLRDRHVNIEELEMDADNAPCTSRMTFHLKASVTVPPTCSVEALGAELRRLERERNLDVVIKRLPTLVAD